MHRELRNCFIKILLVLQVLIFQGLGAGLNVFSQGAELTTVMWFNKSGHRSLAN